MLNDNYTIFWHNLSRISSNVHKSRDGTKREKPTRFLFSLFEDLSIESFQCEIVDIEMSKKYFSIKNRLTGCRRRTKTRVPFPFFFRKFIYMFCRVVVRIFHEWTNSRTRYGNSSIAADNFDVFIILTFGRFF